MNRRSILAGGAAAGVTAAAGVAAPAVAQQTFDWRMVTPWPRNAPGVGVNAQRTADRIEQMSGGRIKITLYTAGELVPPFESFDAVASGGVEVIHATPYYWAGRSPALHFFTGVPYGMTATEFPAWLEFGGGQALWDAAYEPFGVKAFYAGSSGVQAGGWFRDELTGLDDLRGLRMRIAGLGGEVMQRLGVAVQLTPPGEIFAAMQAGAVDAAEWVGPWNDLAFGLHRIAKHYYLPAFHEPGPGLEVVVNRRAWDGLPEDLKAVVEFASKSIAYTTLADFTYHNVVSLAPLVEEHGVTLHTYPEEIIEALGRESFAVLEDIGTASPDTRTVYESYMAFLKQADRYAGRMDLPLLQQRHRVMPT